MKNKKENWFKKNYKLTWIISGIIFVFLLYYVIQYYSPSFQYDEVFDVYEDDWLMSHHGENTYKLKIKVSNVTIGQTWVGEPSEAIIGIYDQDMNLIKSYLGDNLTWGEGREGKFYGKITKSVKFEEGGIFETRYIWLLFELDPLSKDSFEFMNDFEPQIWREEPRITW